MNNTTEKSISVGKYLVSPLVRRNDAGRYNASVSIRDGSHDRVLRFVPEFSCHDSATAYAFTEAPSRLRAGRPTA